jgi:hypothetical protein
MAKATTHKSPPNFPQAVKPNSKSYLPAGLMVRIAHYKSPALQNYSAISQTSAKISENDALVHRCVATRGLRLRHLAGSK